jgi:hypothetical protein
MIHEKALSQQDTFPARENWYDKIAEIAGKQEGNHGQTREESARRRGDQGKND